MLPNMITITTGRPSELIRSLNIINSQSIKHLCVNTQSHFWHTDDNMYELVRVFRSLRNLEYLEFRGDSYPNLCDLSVFLEFMYPRTMNLHTLIMPITPPFPGQYPIQDRSFMINKILHHIFHQQSLTNVSLYSIRSGKNQRNDESHLHTSDDAWVDNLNIKIRTLIRNHNREQQQQSRL